MKYIPTSGFNKEKLAFLGTSTVLALTLYHLLVSAPVALDPTPPVSSTSPPAPLDREKADTRVANVLYYISGGVNPQLGVAVNRGRKNPFEPMDELFDVATPTPKAVKNPNVVAPIPPPPPEAALVKEPEKDKTFDPKADKLAKVDFSGVMTLNGVTYGLLKSKDGETIQVKEGDYMDDYKYTVARIEKQAIWVSDEDNQMFVARDLSFDESQAKSDDGGDEKPKAKAKGGKHDLVAAADKPAASPKPKAAPQNNQNNQNNPNNNRNNNRGGNNRGGRGGGGNNGGGGGNYGGNGNGSNFSNQGNRNGNGF